MIWSSLALRRLPTGVLAPSPKTDAAWQHPAVYLAGRDSDWFFSRMSRNQNLAGIREHYERWVSRAARGEVLEGPERVALSAPTEEAPAQKSRSRISLG